MAGGTSSAPHIFGHERRNGETTLVSVNSAGVQGNANSHFPSIWADGRYVAFQFNSTNLVAGTTNGWSQIFIHARWACVYLPLVVK